MKNIEARGSDRMAHFAVNLARSFGRHLFHGFISGHPGVGKSTETSRVLLQQAKQFRAIRISAALEMFPSDFRIHDLLWLMTLRVLEAAQSPTVSGFSDQLPSDLLEAVRHELSERWIETLGLTGRDLEGGLDLKLIARIKTTLKFSWQRTEKTTEYNFSAISDLIQVVNRVLDESNRVLRKKSSSNGSLS